tara:strand:+ start:869 stop:1018 length:150 start_codon:yes stop_codon:yes gene_type:complete
LAKAESTGKTYACFEKGMGLRMKLQDIQTLSQKTFNFITLKIGESYNEI